MLSRFRFASKTISSLIVFQNQIVEKPVCFVDLNYISKEEKEEYIRRNGYKENIEKVFSDLELVNKFFIDYQNIGFDKTIMDQDKYIELKNKTIYIDKEMIRINEYVLHPQFYNLMPKKKENLPVANIIQQLEKNYNESIEKLSKLKTFLNGIDQKDLEYQSVELGEICNIRRGRVLSRELYIEGEEDKNVESLPFLQVGDLTKITDYVVMNGRRQVSEKFARVNNLQIIASNTLLMTMSGTVGVTVVTGKKVCIDSNIVAIEPKNNKVDIWFLLGWLVDNRQLLEHYTMGISGIPRITRDTLENLKIDIPTKKNASLSKIYVDTIDIVSKLKMDEKTTSQLMKQMPNSIFNKIFPTKDQ